MRARTRIKKWGGSLAIVIGADVVKRKGLKPGAQVEYDVKPVGLRGSDIDGLLADLITPEEMEAIIRDHEKDEGWHE